MKADCLSINLGNVTARKSHRIMNLRPLAGVAQEILAFVNFVLQCIFHTPSLRCIIVEYGSKLQLYIAKCKTKHC